MHWRTDVGCCAQIGFLLKFDCIEFSLRVVMLKCRKKCVGKMRRHWLPAFTIFPQDFQTAFPKNLKTWESMQRVKSLLDIPVCIGKVKF